MMKVGLMTFALKDENMTNSLENKGRRYKLNLNEWIFKRKSTRKYDMTPLDQVTLGNIIDFTKSIIPL